MTVMDGTAWALQAAEAGDLKELARAIQARGAAIASGELPTPEAVAGGERVRAAIETLKRTTRAESARLRRIQEFLPPAEVA
jgi:hypothetical protein